MKRMEEEEAITKKQKRSTLGKAKEKIIQIKSTKKKTNKIK
jgi:hypothetical protein